MEILEQKISVPEGEFITTVNIFNESDLNSLINVYESWRNLNLSLIELNARKANLPEGLSEPSFCLFTNTYRMDATGRSRSGFQSSFDAYDPRGKTRIQIKACSVLPDLTSFGPSSVWDKLYFLDFYRNGDWDGKFDIYDIDNNHILSTKVNKNETFEQMQETGKRPRFSIYDKIIVANNLTPTATFDLYDPETIRNDITL